MCVACLVLGHKTSTLGIKLLFKNRKGKVGGNTPPTHPNVTLSDFEVLFHSFGHFELENNKKVIVSKAVELMLCRVDAVALLQRT